MVSRTAAKGTKERKGGLHPPFCTAFRRIRGGGEKEEKENGEEEKIAQKNTGRNPGRPERQIW